MVRTFHVVENRKVQASFIVTPHVLELQPLHEPTPEAREIGEVGHGGRVQESMDVKRRRLQALKKNRSHGTAEAECTTST